MTTLSILNQSAKQTPHRISIAKATSLANSSPYSLKWRQKLLLLQLSQETDNPYLPVLDDQQELIDCLQRSPVQLVRLDPNIDAAELERWANACAAVNKAGFLHIPTTANLPKKKNWTRWWLKRIIDWMAAATLLLLLGPLMLALGLLVAVQSPGPIFFSQWRVGERGKLFRILKFRTMIVGAEQLHHQVMGNQSGLHKHEADPRVTPVGRWMRKYSLDELPQLINILRGEMSFVGPRPWALYDAVRLSSDVRHRLNALPGITGIWQVTGRSTLRDIDAVNRIDLSYLGNWSLWQDFKILLLTIPKVLSGFGAY